MPQVSRRLLLNLLFGLLAVAGQVGQNVSLPLWIDAGRRDTCGNETPAAGNCTVGRSIDSYFVYTFACISFVLIFGCALPVVKLLSPGSLGSTERQFPQLALLLIGMFDALNGALVVFASSGKRTLPVLQPILSNFMIPLTVGMRLLLLGKRPTPLKAACAGAVFLSLIVSLVPTFVPSCGANLSGGADGVWKFLWPLIFMSGFVPAAAMTVLQEKWLQHRLRLAEAEGGRRLNLVFFLFATSLYQLLTAALLFWVDLLPGYGNASSLWQLGDSWRFGVSCFFGGDGCSWSTGARGGMFIGMYAVSYVGSGLLLRYAEGATLLVIVTSLVTPLGFLFWTFFNEDPFEFRVETGPSTWFALGSLLLMVPAIAAYNLRPESGDAGDTQQLVIQDDDEQQRQQQQQQQQQLEREAAMQPF